MIDTEKALLAFPFLSSVPPGSRQAFLSRSVPKALEHRQVLAGDGSACAYLPLVLEGTLRVYKVSESGKELTLYRIERGESCVLTATCILTGGSFPAMAESEGRSLVALLPGALIASLVEEDRELTR